jgi:predicted DNA-binding transcriptional regulator AlpA
MDKMEKSNNTGLPVIDGEEISPGGVQKLNLSGRTFSPVDKLLLSDREVGTLLGISRTLTRNLYNSGRLPLPIRLRRRTLWRADELKAWIAAGCPERSQWKKINGGTHE